MSEREATGDFEYLFDDTPDESAFDALQEKMMANHADPANRQAGRQAFARFVETGDAAAFQATDGLRADRSIARIETAPGGEGYQVEIHAETPGRSPARRRLMTRGTVELRPNHPGGLSRAEGPGSDRAIVHKATPSC